MSGISTPGAALANDEAVERRAYVRWIFKSTAFPVRMGKKTSEIRLKDLSRGGACGLMDEPVAVGDYILIELDDRHVAEAEVRWVRRVMVGVKFSSPLTAIFVTKLHERASEMTLPADDIYRPGGKTAR